MNSIKSGKVILKKKQDTFSMFLEQFRINDGDNLKITHTSWGKVLGKFHIPEDKVKEFHKLYAIEVQNGTKMGMIEQHREVGPVIVDLDFKFDLDVVERQFTTEDIDKIVEIYMDEIEKTFIINDKINTLMAYVFLRDKPYQFKGNTKDGIHIMFPFIVSVPEIQLVIRNNVIKRMTEENTLEHIGMKNQIPDVIDRSVIDKNGWFMFGSTKPHCSWYYPTHTYDGNRERILVDEANYGGINDIPYFFSIRRYTEDDCTIIRDEKFVELEKISKKKVTMAMKLMKKYNNSHYDVKQISRLLGILSNRRVEEYEMWMDVGFCLYNINNNDIDLLNLWIEFSKRSSKFSEGTCERNWSNMKGSNNDGAKLGIGSLYYWAKKDNPEEYMKIKREDIRYYIDKSLNCTNYDIAKVLHEMYKYQFVCASIKYNTWYEFKDHRWQEDDHAICLRKKISTELVKEYMQIVSNYNEEYVKIEMDDEISLEEKDKAKQEFEDKTKILTNIMLKLKTTSFKDNVMKECRELFYERKFIEKLDSNPYLIGFENGIYDLKKGKFREGEPEDYVSMTTLNNYQEYDDDFDDVFNVMEFIKQVFPNYNVRHYILKLLASILQGGNTEEKFRIFIGTGSNGKSKLMELLALTLGEYHGTFPITLFTGKRAQSNAATPEVVTSKGKRIMQVDEPEEGANINVGLMKNYTGGDKINARGLFKEPVEFEPQFKVILLANEFPTVPPYDGGVWRRLECTEFTSKFIDDPKEDWEYKRDYTLKAKLPEWKEAFMSILIKYYQIYKKEGLTPPDEVTKFTRGFQKDCDAYSDFISDRLVQVNDINVGIKPAEVYREFKVWHTECGTGIKLLTQKQLVTYLEKKYSKKIVTNELIKGFRLKKDMDQYGFSDTVVEQNDEEDDTDSQEVNIDVHIDVGPSPSSVF